MEKGALLDRSSDLKSGSQWDNAHPATAEGRCPPNPNLEGGRGDKVSDIPNEEDITPLGGRKKSIYSAPKWSGRGSEGVEGESAGSNASKRRPNGCGERQERPTKKSNYSRDVGTERL